MKMYPWPKRAQKWEQVGETVLWGCCLFFQQPVDHVAGPLPHSAGKAVTGPGQIQGGGTRLHFLVGGVAKRL